MTGSIQERNVASVLQLHVVCTDVLGNATCLAGNNVGLANIVEQRGLTMVYVTHHSYDGSAGNEI